MSLPVSVSPTVLPIPIVIPVPVPIPAPTSSCPKTVLPKKYLAVAWQGFEIEVGAFSKVFKAWARERVEARDNVCLMSTAGDFGPRSRQLREKKFA